MSSFRSRLLPALLPTLALAGLVAFAAPRADEGPIGTHMEVIEGAMKKLRRAVPDPEQRAACLELVVEIESAALEAKQGVPPMAEKLPEGERAAFGAAYRKEMVQLMTRVLELETALIDGEQEAIDTAYRKLRAMEDSGHERFTDEG